MLHLAKMIGIFVGVLLVIVLVASVLFVYLNPEFGGRATAEEQRAYAGERFAWCCTPGLIR